jgi:hypothetical protein
MNKVIRSPANCDDDIKRLYIEEKFAMNKIAVKLNISVGKVYNRIKAMGIQTRRIGDYPSSEKVLTWAKKLGESRKGILPSKETRQKMSESAFKGGIGHKKKRKDGYISVYFPDHPKSNKSGYIMEHILVMEAITGRHLKDGECVHHKNFNRQDNRACNLKLMTTKEHMSYHMKIRNKQRRESKCTIK